MVCIWVEPVFPTGPVKDLLDLELFLVETEGGEGVGGGPSMTRVRAESYHSSGISQRLALGNS